VLDDNTGATLLEGIVRPNVLRKMQKHGRLRRLMFQLSLLMEGARHAYLYDDGILSTAQLSALMQCLEQKCRAICNLKLVVVAHNVFIINQPGLKHRFECQTELHDFCLINVANEDRPVLCSSIFKTNLLAKMCKFIQTLDESISGKVKSGPATPELATIEFPEGIALPSLAGLLLGYPCVYCWEPKPGIPCDTTVNSLSMVPLTVCSMNMRNNDDDLGPCFQFSVPSELMELEDVRSAIEMAQMKTFSSINLKLTLIVEQVVTLPIVGL